MKQGRRESQNTGMLMELATALATGTQFAGTSKDFDKKLVGTSCPGDEKGNFIQFQSISSIWPLHVSSGFLWVFIIGIREGLGQAGRGKWCGPRRVVGRITPVHSWLTWG